MQLRIINRFKQQKFRIGEQENKQKAEIRWISALKLTVPTLVHFVHPALNTSAMRGAALLLAHLLPVSFGQHRDGLHFLLPKRGINGREFSVGKLFEFDNHVLEFATERIGAGRLVVSRSSFVLIYASVELAEMFTDPLFSRDHATFLGGHNLGTNLIG